MSASVSLAVSHCAPLAPAAPEEANVESWYSLQTRPRHEKIVVQRLEEKGVTTFLPLVTEVHRWSDRQ